MPLRYPPNPRQFLDRRMPDAPTGQPSARRGQLFFMNTQVDGGLTCNQCHSVATGTNGQLIDRIALQAAQDMKVPQLRNMYKKTGFTDLPGAVNKRGFGFTHNGSTDNLFNFLKFPGFNFAAGAAGDAQRRDLEAFLLAFDTGTAPAVGAQVTFDGGGGDAGRIARMDTLAAQADSGYCDLVAHGRAGGAPRGWTYSAGGWLPDVTGSPALSSAQLRATAGAGAELTVTGVPHGSGERMGRDRDRDTYPDGDERLAGSDPGDPASTPANVGVPLAGSRGEYALRGARPNPSQGTTALEFALPVAQAVDLVIYDVLGREVRTLARGTRFEAGAHRIPWDGRRGDGGVAGAGVYFVRLHTAQGTKTASLVRIP
jgi:hypothetical protein